MSVLCVERNGVPLLRAAACLALLATAPVFPLALAPTLTADADADLILNGQSFNDRFGGSVASAGDFNGDGKEDVIVGAIGDDNNGADSGSAFIFFGGATGTVDADDADVILNGDLAGQVFGEAVSSAGDFNGDGKSDVIVGSSGADPNGTNSGAAYIFFGGVTGTIDAGSADVILNGQNAGDQFGWSVASAGDFNGDGKSDAIVGANQADPNGTGSGRAYIFFGGQTGTIDANSADVILNGESTDDRLGSAVSSAGDFDGDGKDDVIVGAVFDDNNASNAGSAFLWLGGVTGTLETADADVILNGDAAHDWFGYSVASVGDFDGDGKDDVIVGARLVDSGGADSGSAFVFLGGRFGTFDAADADVILNGGSAFDHFGVSVASAGDLNDDGKSDAIVGAHQADDNGSNAGSAFVFLGGTAGTIGAASADQLITGQNGGDSFGISVASAGDFSGDGLDDLIVGAELDDNNDALAGSAFVFFGGLGVVADAGPDQTVDEGVSVQLDGTGSTPDPGSLNFDWSQVAGPAVTLAGAATAMPGFDAPYVAGSQTLTFQLVVDDGTSFSEADTVDVVVVSVNNPPVADAGDDSTIKPGALATLDGGNSFDPESDPITYLWTQVVGTAVTLSDPTAQQPAFVAPDAVGETLFFVLEVSDGKEASTPSPGTDSSEPDTVAITLVANSRPVADAGPDQTRDEGALVTLDGSGSFDADGGDLLSFQWTQTAGAAAVLSDPTAVAPTFTAPGVGAGGDDLTFSLVVSDDDPVNPLSSLPDEVSIHVANVNDPPSCELAVARPGNLWPPNHKMIPVIITGVVDPDGGTEPVTVQVTGVTQDEPVDGLGDGDSSPDAVILDPQEGVLVRAERAGDANGRVYRIGFTASDGLDSCQGSVTVTVPHSRQASPVDDGQLYDSTAP